MKKQIDRRHMLLSSLFGAGALGLRSLASGIPAAVLLDPRKALADVDAGTPGCTPGKAQYLILSVSFNGEPIGCNVPGTYDDPSSSMDFSTVGHPSGFGPPVQVMMGGTPYMTAAPWAELLSSPISPSSTVMSRTCFFHDATGTSIHTEAPQVLEVMGATKATEMLPSAIAKYTGPCLGTVQTQPVCLGLGPQNAIQYEGQNLPLLSAANLSQIFNSAPGTLKDLESVRDKDLSRINDFLKSYGTKQQQTFIESYATSQTQLRSISDTVVGMLDYGAGGGPYDQLSAAAVLIKMNLSPVIVVSLPFGGDNHVDKGLQAEVTAHNQSLAALKTLMASLQAFGIQDQVTFASWNVFGRTMYTGGMNQGVAQGVDGRNHNPNHHCMVMIGKNVKSSVIGGLQLVPYGDGDTQLDYGARDIVTSASSKPIPVTNDNVPNDTLTSAAKTLMAACGVDPTAFNDVFASTDSPTSFVIPEALA